MEDIDIRKHTTNTLRFVFVEASKHAQEVFLSLRVMVNKSYLVLGLYVSISSYSFTKLSEGDYLFSIILVGSLLGIWFCHKNLFPSKRSYLGSLPEVMLNSFFDKFKDDELEKELLAAQIQAYNSAAKVNLGLLEQLVKRFKLSLIVTALSFVFFGVSFFASWIVKCFVL